MIPGNANPLLLASAAEAAAAGVATKSLRFNSGDSSSLTRTPSSAGNRKTFTFSCWVKRSKLGGSEGIFDCRPASGSGMTDSNLTVLYFDTDNELKLSGAVTEWRSTSQVFRDVSSFYHIVLAVDTTSATAADRIKLYVNGSQVTDFGSNNNPSQNHEFAWNLASKHAIGSNTLSTPTGHINAYLADIYFVDGSQLDATSFGAYDDSGVWQAAAYSGTYGTNGFHLLDFANESTVGHDSSGNENDFTANNITGSLTNYSDDISIDSGNFYLDGRSGRFGFDGNSSTYIDCRLGTGANTTTNIIWEPTGGIASVTKIRVNSQYATHYRINEGSWTSFTSDGSTVQIFSGSAFTLTKLEIRRNNNGGSDFGHRVTFYEINDVEYQEDDPNDLDVLFDVPTNGEATDTGAGGEVGGNYCTLNPLKKSSEITLSNGNLDLSTSSTSNKCKVFGTFGVSSGKWYYEVTIGANHRGSVGWATSQDSNLAQAPGDSTGDYSLTFDTNKIYQGSYTSGYGTAFFTGMVIGVRVDATAGTIAFSQNGTDKGDAFTGQTGKTFWPIVGDASSGGTFDGSVNFGQRAFVYSAPSGYKALCTTNLPTPTIADGSDYFETVTWTGTGASKSLTTGFSPDFIWLKNRAISSNHRIFDTVRGQGVMLHTNTNNSDQSDTNNLTSFDSNGFTVGTNSNTNGSGNGIVAWCWDAGSSTASNTDGSITSSVRANQTAGFSIVSYSGSGSNGTIGHGLNAAPSLIITKCRNTASIDWIVYSPEIDDGKILILNGTNAQFTGAGGKYGTVGSSTYGVVEQTNFGNLNASGSTYIAYCFAPVAGYSAFGSYEGNGSSTVGPFISTGFRVNYLLVKNVDTASHWFIFDAVRDPENTNGKILRASDTTTEFDGGTEYIDFLSNGFKLRTDIDPFNKNGDTYIYWAIAENPFQANGGLAR